MASEKVLCTTEALIIGLDSYLDNFKYTLFKKLNIT